MTGNSDTPGVVVPSAMAARLQTAANIAVRLASASVLWMVWQRTQPTAPEPPPTYAVGEQMDAVDGVDFRSSGQTLVLAFREDCRFCQDSVPFYQKLTAAAGAATARAFQLAVVSTDPQATLSAYLTTNAIEVDHIVSIRPGALKIPGTPHLLLVDSNGVVQQVWQHDYSPVAVHDVRSVSATAEPVAVRAQLVARALRVGLGFWSHEL